MQTTLLGLAIAIILALVAALVGPHFVDWSQYRAEFESRASAVTGLNVRVAGAIDARLLPTPALTLQQIEVGRPGEPGTLRARSLAIEFSLGALARGEWRATSARVDGADIAVSLDASGRLDWPVPSIAVDPETASIERLDVVDSRAVLADAASGSRLVLDKLEFRGELRSFAGPIKGEGAFMVGAQHYPYRVSASRAGDDGGVRVRLNIDPIDRPLIADVDAFVFVERGVPRFEGTLQLARPVGRAPDGIIEPWRITSHVKGDGASAVLEQIEYQYGPDDRAIKLRGDANLVLGRAPQLTVGLTAAQVDLDRGLGLGDTTRRRPLAAVRALADAFAGAQRPPIPTRLGVSVENVMLAGTMLQRVNAELKGDADSWDVEVLELRAPGAAQIRLSGRLDVDAKGLGFAGPVRIEARDTRALVAWLTDRNDAQTFAAGALRAEGEVKLGSDAIAVERLKIDLDRMTVEGRFAYSWAAGEQPARLEAALNAPEIDLDRTLTLAQGVFADTAFEWPREGMLALKVGRATLAGVELKRADVAVRFNRQGLEIDRFALGDLNGAAFAAKGRIETGRSGTAAPRGTVTLDLDARALDGLAALVERFAPEKAAEFTRRAARFVPAKVRATLSINADPARPAGSPAIAAFKLEGNAGGFRINLQGSADRVGDASGGLTIDSFSRLGGSKVGLGGRLEAADGGALVELLGLQSAIAVDKRPGRLEFTANGPFDGEIAVDGQLLAGGLDVSTKGTTRLSGSQGATAALVLKVTNANLRSPRPAAAGRPSDTLPAALTAKLALAHGIVALSDLTGTVAGADISGRLKLDFSQSLSVDGDVELAEINLPVALAAAIGTPISAGGATTVWPAEPFEQGLLGQLSGRLTVKSAHVSLTPRLAAKKVRAIVQFGPSEIEIDEIDGTLAGGRVAGDMAFRRGEDGVTASMHLKFAGADLAEIVRGGPPPLSGRLTFNVALEGTGRSPIAVVGALHGGGTFTIQDGQIVRLDPAAFDAVIRSVDQGLPIDVARIRDRMEQALASGGLAIPLAEGEVAIAAGQARLGNLMVRTQGADLALAGSVVLAEDLLDAKLTLSASERKDAPGALRPEIGIVLKGAVDAPRRTLDTVTFTNWLALRAVDLQTRRINALESNRDAVTTSAPATGTPTTKPPASGAPAPGTPAPGTPGSGTPAAATPAAATPAAPAQSSPAQPAPAQPAPGQANTTHPPRSARTTPEPPAGPSRPRAATPVTPTSPSVPSTTVRPPLDIRPSATTRPPARQAQPPAQPPARSNSWFGFGNSLEP